MTRSDFLLNLHNIHSTHKVSAGWFQQCGGWFDNACGRGVTDDRYSKRFWGYLKETGFHERLTTKEDIQFVDVLLREFIAELETKC